LFQRAEYLVGVRGLVYNLGCLGMVLEDVVRDDVAEAPSC
jgi:hypothetical protein